MTSIEALPTAFEYNVLDDMTKFYYTNESAPESLNWSSKIKIKSHKTELKIWGNQSNDSTFSIPAQVSPNAFQLLQSNLQKCVRRKEQTKALRTALALYSYNPFSLLRRMAIIWIEDSLPHPASFIKLIWWMIATTKGYILSKQEVESMLGMIVVMYESTTYEVFTNRIVFDEPKIDEWVKLSPEQRAFLWALELRIIYGGLKVDTKMIKYHQSLWLTRMLEDKTKWSLLTDQEQYEVEVDSIAPINIIDILPSSIDYHCFSWIPDKLAEKINLSKDQIRLAIWQCSSRTNLREPINKSSFIRITSTIERDYKLIERELKGLSQLDISHNYSSIVIRLQNLFIIIMNK